MYPHVGQSNDLKSKGEELARCLKNLRAHVRGGKPAIGRESCGEATATPVLWSRLASSMSWLGISSIGWRRRSLSDSRAPRVQAPAPAKPNRRRVAEPGAGSQREDEEPPPWTPRSAIEPPRPVFVPDDALSSPEPSPARSPVGGQRWAAGLPASARKVDPPPWVASSQDEAAGLPLEDGADLPSPAPSPLNAATRPKAKFCTVCGSLYTTAVCRCTMLSFNHPITRIVATSGQSPQSPPVSSSPALNADGTPAVADTAARSGAQRALWAGAETPPADGGGTDLSDVDSAAPSASSSPVPHVHVQLSDDELRSA